MIDANKIVARDIGLLDPTGSAVPYNLHPALVVLKDRYPMLCCRFREADSPTEQFVYFMDKHKKMLLDPDMRSRIAIVVSAIGWTRIAFETFKPDMEQLFDPVTILQFLRTGMVAFYEGIHVVCDAVLPENERIARYDVNIVSF